MPLTIGLFGTGRLGSAIRDAAASQDDLAVAWAVGRGTLPEAPVDVAIDVSHADSVAAHLAWAGRTGTPLVIGTTGWDSALLDERPAPGTLVPVLVAPNFSIGVALLRRLAGIVGGYAATSPVDVDLAVTDSHHRHKADAPSGTALALREALARGAGRADEAVQTTSLRIGSVVGEHEVIAASELETITLRHAAHDRRLFATGALTAARWLVTRSAGVHTLDDLAEGQLRAMVPDAPATGASTDRPASGIPEAVA